MKGYLQVNEQTKIITDCIDYPHGNYIEHETESIPVGVHGGWFKFENGVIVEIPSLKPISKDEEIAQLKSQLLNQTIRTGQIELDFMAFTDYVLGGMQ